MLGIIRFLLASCVVAFHLTGKLPFLGQFAVNFFYIISGFLITLILNKTYKFNVISFSANRFLRLYPTYFFFVFVGIIIIYFMPNTVNFHPSWSRNSLSLDWLGNALIFPWAFLSDYAVPNTFGAFTDSYPFFADAFRFRIITSSWSVAVELICYFLLWLFIARNIAYTVVSIVVSVAYHIFVYRSTSEPAMAYFPFIAAILPFSLGSLGYFIYTKVKKVSSVVGFLKKHSWILLFSSVILFFANWGLFTFSQNGHGHWHPFYYYVNNVISMFIVIALCDLNPEGGPGKVARLLGDLSYPVFLSQYFGGYLAWYVIGFNEPNRGWEIFIIGYGISIAMSLVCIYLIDENIRKVRDKVRNAAVS
ncbi:acyltransferase family protein [Pantoea piersonii]|uniref:acyltransferase family protein n=1 Tax=Pantoea piersonii TaxID=2364647 RepID=UPI00289A42D9|nr:acyltransferase [Pantoea piersonii]